MRMVNFDGKLFRISNSNSRRIEYSINNGYTWIPSYIDYGTTGSFESLLDNGNEMLAQTEKGLCYTTDGFHWLRRGF